MKMKVCINNNNIIICVKVNIMVEIIRIITAIYKNNNIKIIRIVTRIKIIVIVIAIIKKNILSTVIRIN